MWQEVPKKKKKNRMSSPVDWILEDLTLIVILYMDNIHDLYELLNSFDCINYWYLVSKFLHMRYSVNCVPISVEQ